MRAIVHRRACSLEDPDALVEVSVPEPITGPKDLLVRIEAVSVNPVDTKVRGNMEPDGEHRILGWDAVGRVAAIGSEAHGFTLGDRVWYAGELTRAGSNAELQAVDHRLVSTAPSTVDPTRAASLPLTGITAWELLFDRLGLEEGGSADRVVLVSGAAGGVGSILVQLVATLTQATVVATAGRAESADWIRGLGAHHLISYREPLAPQIAALAVGAVTDVASLTHTDTYLAQFAECLAPGGRIALIDDPPAIDIGVLKPKSLSLHWEFMYTRSMFRTEDMQQQQRILGRIAQLVDAGRIRTTEQASLGALSVERLTDAHRRLESGRSRGKIVLSGFAEGA